jgi:multidrug efflux system membrane fusion protein
VTPSQEGSFSAEGKPAGNPPSHEPGGEKQPVRRKRPWWLWVLGIVIILAAIAWWTHRGADPQAKNTVDPASRPTMISVATAKQGDIGVYLNALGTVTPVYTVTVTSRVQGEITKVYYHEGQMVKKGDPLLEIDPRPYQAALTQVEGQLAHDQAVLTEAKIDLERYQQAYSRNAIAKQQMDDQQQVVLQDEGTVKNDEGQLANAKVNLDYTHITAPIEGRVGLRLVDPGNIVQANSSTGLVVITQLQPITVIFSLAEDYLAQIQAQVRKGQKLPVDALDRAQLTKLASGSLLTLDNVIDTSTGTLKLKAVFPNTDGALFPNQFVNARMLLDTQKNVTLIPTPAIQRNAQGAFVYIIKSDQTATIRTMTTGTTDAGMTAVDGVQPGEVVAVTGFDKLQDNAKVAIRQPTGTPPGTGATAGPAKGQAGRDSGNKQGGAAN